jgi:hypothetical protein
MQKNLVDKIDNVWADIADAKIKLKKIKTECVSDVDSVKIDNVIYSIDRTTDLLQDIR